MPTGSDLELLLQLADVGDADPMLRWSEVFGCEKQVEIEIGIGKGRFLIDAALRREDVHYVGVEWAMKYVRMAHARCVRRGLFNVRFVRADAHEFVEFFVPARSVSAYHIYFPDPWPKKRHHKRRLIQPKLVHDLATLLRADGYLHLATDWVPYAEHMFEVLDA